MTSEDWRHECSHCGDVEHLERIELNERGWRWVYPRPSPARDGCKDLSKPLMVLCERCAGNAGPGVRVVSAEQVEELEAMFRGEAA